MAAPGPGDLRGNKKRSLRAVGRRKPHKKTPKSRPAQPRPARVSRHSTTSPSARKRPRAPARWLYSARALPVTPLTSGGALAALEDSPQGENEWSQRALPALRGGCGALGRREGGGEREKRGERSGERWEWAVTIEMAGAALARPATIERKERTNQSARAGRRRRSEASGRCRARALHLRADWSESMTSCAHFHITALVSEERAVPTRVICIKGGAPRGWRGSASSGRPQNLPRAPQCSPPRTLGTPQGPPPPPFRDPPGTPKYPRNPAPSRSPNKEPIPPPPVLG